MTSNTMLNVGRAGLLVAAAMSAGFATGGTLVDSAVPSKTVSYADLNLATEQGAATLYRRIRYAAEEVCRPALITGSLIRRPGYRACMARAVSEAVAKVDKPALSAYYAKKEHRLTVEKMAAANGHDAGG